MTEKYRKGLGKKESYLLSALARNNRNIFNTDDVKTIVDGAAKRTILGYLFEASGLLKEHEGIFKSTRLSKGYSLLDPLSPKTGAYNDKWGLLVNMEIKPERWMY